MKYNHKSQTDQNKNGQPKEGDANPRTLSPPHSPLTSQNATLGIKSSPLNKTLIAPH